MISLDALWHLSRRARTDSRRLTRAAASSIARGRLSSGMQIFATARALAASRTKLGLAAWARCTNNETASIAANWSKGGSCVGSGRGSDGTGYSHSHRRWSGVRLVTRVLDPVLTMGGQIRHVASAALGCLVGSRDNDLDPRQP